MEILPAIDVLDDKVVRLLQGRYDEVTVYGDDPAAQALRFAEEGAAWVHVVDLEGARRGVPTILEHVRRIARIGIKVEIGGGIRSMESLERSFEAGASRCVLGTSLVRDPAFVRRATGRFGEGIIAGVDAREGEVAIEGWRQGSRVAAGELVRELETLGIRRLAYTDISRDGTREGVNAEAYRELAASTPLGVIASGGVATLEDVRALAALDGAVEGVIVGRALYEREFTLEEAIAAASGAVSC